MGNGFCEVHGNANRGVHVNSAVAGARVNGVWTSEETKVTASRCHEVLVTRSGVVSLDSQRVSDGREEDHHAVILDVLQQHAMSRGEPVEAIVLDRRERYAVRIEVAPDGSSRLVSEY